MQFKYIFSFIYDVKIHLKLCKIIKWAPVNLLHLFLSTLYYPTYSVTCLVEIRIQRQAMCHLLSLPPGFYIIQPHSEDLTLWGFHNRKESCFPSALSYSFPSVLSQLKKVKVLPEIDQDKFLYLKKQRGTHEYVILENEKFLTFHIQQP